MKWYFKLLIGLVILSTIAGLAYRETLIWRHPRYVRHYQNIMKTISSEDYIGKLNNYTSKLTEYPNLSKYEQLLKYLGQTLTYTKDPYIERHEDPIEILNHMQSERCEVVSVISKEVEWIRTGNNGTFGRCGEFVIAYAALCIAEGYDVRIILDTNDHMWVEILTIPPSNTPQMGRWNTIPLQWIHIEVTDGATWCRNNPDKNPIDCPMINDPYRYYTYNNETKNYEKKIDEEMIEMKEIWAIQPDFAERVEENYQWE